MMGLLAYLVPSSFHFLITRDIVTLTHSEWLSMETAWLPRLQPAWQPSVSIMILQWGKDPGSRMPHRGRAR